MTKSPSIEPDTRENNNHEDEALYFRPHHFLCTLSFRGKGYSLGFVKNYKKIVAQINDDEDTTIEVVEYMDDICSPCPNKLDNKLCKIQNKILQLDSRHSKILDIKPGTRLSWKQAKTLIKNKMSIDKFHFACNGCQWKQYGLCEASLRELQNSNL